MYAMYDFETLGQTADTKVVSLGAVLFNRDGILSTKYYVFDWENQPGRTEDPDTVAWWARQSPDARLVFDTPKEKRISLKDFIKDHDEWLQVFTDILDEKKDKKTGCFRELYPMSNGANFDLVIIEDIYRREHEKGRAAIPWPFWNTYCFRTIEHLFKVKDLRARNESGNKVVKHNALDDAIYQTNCILDLWALQDKNKKEKALKDKKKELIKDVVRAARNIDFNTLTPKAMSELKLALERLEQ